MIRGLGPKKREMLKNIGIEQYKYLLFLYPRQYDDRSKKIRIRDAVDGENAFMTLTITSQPHTRYLRRGMRMTRAHATDGTDFITLVFFNQPYIANRLKMHTPYDVYGKIKEAGAAWADQSGGRKPRHGKDGAYCTGVSFDEGISQNDMLSFTGQAVALYAKDLPEILPQDLRDARGLIGLAEAEKPCIGLLHGCLANRVSDAGISGILCFLCRNANAKSKKQNTACAGYSCRRSRRAYIFFAVSPDRCAKARPGGDYRGYGERQSHEPIVAGRCGIGQNHRRLFGDLSGVSCGFSVGVHGTHRNSRPAASCLAHESDAVSRFATGAAFGKHAAKRARGYAAPFAKRGNGCVDRYACSVGGRVQFQNLGLAVTDEQHRFGVKQRAALSQRKTRMLVMSATPIPRTLALLWYGDLEISTIDELPAGRIRLKRL